jgi:hypothetical protein
MQNHVRVLAADAEIPQDITGDVPDEAGDPVLGGVVPILEHFRD